MKGATEELDPPAPAPDVDAAPDAVPAGALVVEAVGYGAAVDVGVNVALAVPMMEVATTTEDEASAVSAAAVVLAAVDAGAAYGTSLSQSAVTCYKGDNGRSLLKDIQLLRIGTRRQRSIERQVQSRLHNLIPRKEGQRTQ